MAVSGGWNNFIELSLSIDEWITIEISQVNQGGKVRENLLCFNPPHQT